MGLNGEYDPTSDTDCLRMQHQLEDCLPEIRDWMLMNMLKINDSKTELITFMNPQQARVFQETDSTIPSIMLGDSVITATNTVRNLAVVMDSRLDGSAQLSAVLRSCNYHRSQIARVRHYISDSACKLAVLGLVIYRLDYCNGLLSAATELQLNKLQLIQHRAARLSTSHRS